MSTQARLSALSAWLSAVLEAHDATFTVATFVDISTHIGADVGTLRRVMGRPLRYAEVIYTGQAPPPERFEEDAGYSGDRFHVRVRYEHASTAENNEAWLSLLAGDGGLLTRLRRRVYLEAADAYAQQSTPASVYVTDIDFAQRHFAHECEFEVIVF